MRPMLYVNGRPLMDDEDTDSVTLEFSADGPTHRCRRCGDDLAETLSGFEGELTGSICPDYAPDDDGPDEGPHVAERMPLSWCNSAGISVDEHTDAVTVSLSLGDPRGAFTFTVARVPDDADGQLAGRLVMYTPYPGEPQAHAPLRQISPGTYVVGHGLEGAMRPAPNGCVA